MCFIVKYVLLIANFIFTLAGLTLLGLGIAALVNTSDLSGVATTPLNAIAISIIVLGAVVFFIAFFGCCGSMKENRCLLLTYALCLLLLAGAKIYLTVLMFNGADSVGELVEEWITKAFNNNELRDTFHAIENTFECCGTNGPYSYIGVLPALPPSCCPDNVSQCESSNAYGGCINIVTDFLSKYSGVFGSIFASILAVEFVAMLFAVMLACNIGGKRRQNV
ncbi:unnamed protein product [Pieris macdunnoughi]|uniref:Tetraspanin n=1 Tax=Pieris macdunnoughi TaxID=345717 RepID=A0A821QVU6_9NEOP|nr:unnamed protein product [Pieris macdunnoughi]